MLIEFSVGNFGPFKEKATLSLIAAKIRSKDKQIDEDHVIQIDDDLGLLRSAAVYGANASGKSKLVAAAAFMRRWVRESFASSPTDANIPVEPFRLSTETENQPSFFEIVFLLEKQQYRYGFVADRARIHSEWLYAIPAVHEIKLFEREDQQIIPNASQPLAKEFRAIEKMLKKINPEHPLRPNTLFLSVAAQNNGPTAQKVFKWFSQMRFMSGLSDYGFRNFTLEMFENPSQKAQIIELVHALDVDIEDILVRRKTKEETLAEIPEEIRGVLSQIATGAAYEITTQHYKRNAQGEIVRYETLDMDIHESAGTQKLFFMVGPIIDTLSRGRVLWVDEMEARLHPKMTDAIVNLFNSPATNPHNAQLIFTTHDTNLLNVRKMRRDQIWFIEKDRMAASLLYSLVEFKIRNDDASLEQDYIDGRYGAIPHLGELHAAYEVETV